MKVDQNFKGQRCRKLLESTHFSDLNLGGNWLHIEGYYGKSLTTGSGLEGTDLLHLLISVA